MSETLAESTSPEAEATGADSTPTEKPSLRARLVRLRDAHPTAVRNTRWALNILAALLVLGALLLPNKVPYLHIRAFARIPAEAIIGAAVMLALPRRPRLVVAVVSGAGLGVMTILNLLDMGFNDYLGRPFNPVLDWELLDDAQSYVADSMGKGWRSVP